jgi:methanogenic corrinoid protein MtbC1
LSAILAGHLLSGDERAAQQFAIGLYERNGDVSSLCDEIFAPALHRVGSEWAEDRLSIFCEHAATQCALSAMSVLRSRLKQPPDDAPVAICASLTDDPYWLAPAMCSLVMTDAGFHTMLLGPNTPSAEVLAASAGLAAAVVVLSVSVEPKDPEPLSGLCKELDARGVRVAIGGRQLTPMLRRAIQPDFLGDSMGHLATFASRVIRDRPRLCRGDESAMAAGREEQT